MPFLPPDALSANSVSVSTQMQTGDAAIAIMYTGSAAGIDDPTKSKFAGKFGFAIPPSVEEGGGPWATLNLDGFAVAKNSPVDKDLLAQIAAVGSGAAATKAAGRLAFPTRMSVRDDPEMAKTAPHWAAGTASVEGGAHPYPSKPYFLPLQTAVRPFLADGVSGKLTVEEALAQAQAEAEKIIAESK
jgi:sorbitol/mannitol transport system substrate-binding protein